MRRTLFVLLAFAVLGVVAPVTLADDDQGFGSKVAGVWFGFFGAPPGETPFIQTYNADGTAQTSTTTPTTSLHHLTWEKTGSREITWRLLHFNFNAQGLTFISRTTAVQEYDNRFAEFTGAFRIEFCPCDGGPPPPFIDPNVTYDCRSVLDALYADPNDPGVCTALPFTVPLEGKRLEVNVPSSPW